MATKVTKPPKTKEKPRFEPGKSYEWKPEDEFVLNGNEFSLIYNVLRTKSQEASAILDSFRVMQKLFEAGIEEGTITEVKQDAPAPMKALE